MQVADLGSQQAVKSCHLCLYSSHISSYTGLHDANWTFYFTKFVSSPVSGIVKLFNVGKKTSVIAEC